MRSVLMSEERRLIPPVMGLLIDMVDAVGVDERGAALDTVHFVALFD